MCHENRPAPPRTARRGGQDFAPARRHRAGFVTGGPAPRHYLMMLTRSPRSVSLAVMTRVFAWNVRCAPSAHVISQTPTLCPLPYPPASALVTATARSRFIAARIAPICFSFMQPKMRVAVASSSRSKIGAASSGRMLW